MSGALLLRNPGLGCAVVAFSMPICSDLTKWKFIFYSYKVSCRSGQLCRAAVFSVLSHFDLGASSWPSETLCPSGNEDVTQAVYWQRIYTCSYCFGLEMAYGTFTHNLLNWVNLMYWVGRKCNFPVCLVGKGTEHGWALEDLPYVYTCIF